MHMDILYVSYMTRTWTRVYVSVPSRLWRKHFFSWVIQLKNVFTLQTKWKMLVTYDDEIVNIFFFFFLVLCTYNTYEYCVIAWYISYILNSKLSFCCYIYQSSIRTHTHTHTSDIYIHSQDSRISFFVWNTLPQRQMHMHTLYLHNSSGNSHAVTPHLPSMNCQAETWRPRCISITPSGEKKLSLDTTLDFHFNFLSHQETEEWLETHGWEVCDVIKIEN